jgi:hypothetical protein
MNYIGTVTENISKSIPCKTGTSKTETGRKLPVDLLGRGHRWPGWRRGIDREIWEKILWREVGGI